VCGCFVIPRIQHFLLASEHCFSSAICIVSRAGALDSKIVSSSLYNSPITKNNQGTKQKQQQSLLMVLCAGRLPYLEWIPPPHLLNAPFQDILVYSTWSISGCCRLRKTVYTLIQLSILLIICYCYFFLNVLSIFVIKEGAHTRGTGRMENGTAWASSRAAAGFTVGSGRKDSKAVTVSANH
jgi:hypothetical protein